ncbi:calcium/sodium antiporter [Natronococcus jeotgali]|uniref:CaCA family Na+/Ca+ antiporter n=1 Tax=Natronococcus jeotgali DSM 18795 TaxID=1227498 RepID=L9WTZ6_9EURY|nr:calcium/sodium antiporter [Natronococcus jeotgali]ELY52930.1 CaCA family Na+/Ca+ antiporter [Natronococcus jeotgali DSM 18795]
MSTLLGPALVLVAATVGLWFGARWLVDAASSLAGAAGVSPLVIGLTVVAFGTSAPELAVSTVAALEGTGDVAVGNVVGSNVFNLGIVLGIVALLRPFRVSQTLVRRDAVAMAAATAIATVILANRVVSRPEGAFLIVLLVGYTVGLAIDAHRQRTVENPSADDGGEFETARDRTPLDPSEPPVRFGLEIGRLLVGLALVVGGGRALVGAATTIGLAVGISEWTIGVTVVAAGTSLPELVTSVVAVRREAVAIAAGNVVGSNVFNLLGVLGVSATIRPTVVDPAVPASLVWLGVITAAATVVLATGRRLTRLEGLFLLAFAICYWAASAVA